MCKNDYFGSAEMSTMTTVSGAALLLFFGSFLAPPLVGFAGILFDRERSLQYLAASVLGVGLTSAYVSVPLTETTVLGTVVNPGAIVVVPVAHWFALRRANREHRERILLVYASPALLEAATVINLLTG